MQKLKSLLPPGNTARGATILEDGGEVIRVRDLELHLWQGVLDRPQRGIGDGLLLFKDRRFLSALCAVLDGLAPQRMVEVGVLQGGSTIYWAERYTPELLVAFDLALEAPRLTQYLERHGLTDRVRTHFGVSQDDGSALRAAVETDFAGRLIDVVVDDASHQYEETRTTVETLFPFLRAGGAYVIEDWAWGHAKDWPAGQWAERSLMSPLLTELMLVCGYAEGVIERIDIDRNFAVLWRGPVPLPRDGSFKLTDHYSARGFAAAFGSENSAGPSSSGHVNKPFKAQ